MICSRTFVREKIDIGIYKALGFTSRNLRLQFAVRFLIVAFFGIIIGTMLSHTLSEKLLSYMLRSMGIVIFVIEPVSIWKNPDVRRLIFVIARKRLDRLMHVSYNEADFF